MNPRVWAFDLELNKPSNKIIQIGAVVGDIRTGEVLSKLNIYVNPHEPISAFITELTGITQEQADQGMEMSQTAKNLEDFVVSHKACKSPIVWGNGDLRHLQAQTQDKDNTLCHIHREIDIKTIHQFRCIAVGKGMKGGLEKSLGIYRLPFIGRPHNALDDAYNTFLLAKRFYLDMEFLSTLEVL